MRFEHRFVEEAPRALEAGVLYVSIQHKSVLHLCACGCGNEVVTPLAPHRWQLIFDGESVSLEPSVGNSVLPCRSHYFITNGEVDWHRPMTDKSIALARRRDQRAIAERFASTEDVSLRRSRDLDTESLSASRPLDALGPSVRPVPAPGHTSTAPTTWLGRLRRRLKQ